MPSISSFFEKKFKRSFNQRETEVAKIEVLEARWLKFTVFVNFTKLALKGVGESMVVNQKDILKG